MAEDIKNTEEEIQETVVAEENAAEELEVVEDSELEALKKENEELKAEAAKWKDDYIRKVAEVENFKSRMQRDKEEFMKFSSEKLIIKMLDAVDNLERGIGASKETKDFDGLVKGVEMTLGQMHRILDEEGVAPVEAVGQEFDPYKHHAMMQEETEEYEHNTVIMELQKGYEMKGKVIRPSLVKVAKNKK